MMFKNKRKISLFMVSSERLFSTLEVTDRFHHVFVQDSILRLYGDRDA
jgi:hypothetical protein